MMSTRPIRQCPWRRNSVQKNSSLDGAELRAGREPAIVRATCTRLGGVRLTHGDPRLELDVDAPAVPGQDSCGAAEAVSNYPRARVRSRRVRGEAACVVSTGGLLAAGGS